MKRFGRSFIGVIATILLGAAEAASATGYSGPVIDVRSAASPSTPGNVRVSIQVAIVNLVCTGSGALGFSMIYPTAHCPNFGLRHYSLRRTTGVTS
jgi:hypothetical protein